MGWLLPVLRNIKHHQNMKRKKCISEVIIAKGRHERSGELLFSALRYAGESEKLDIYLNQWHVMPSFWRRYFCENKYEGKFVIPYGERKSGARGAFMRYSEAIAISNISERVLNKYQNMRKSNFNHYRRKSVEVCMCERFFLNFLCWNQRNVEALAY